MKLAARAVLLLLMVAPVAGCRPWASLAENKLSIAAPARVDRKGEFSFTVHATDRYGDPDAVAFHWVVAWVGVNGSVYNGSSGVTEKIQVKGGTGKAMLKILGYDTHQKWGEIANHVFDVE